MEQDIRFFTSRDGVHLAYAVTGSGPPLVVPSPWITHLELDWQDPFRGDFYRALASKNSLVRFDRYGCGLSDRDRDNFSYDVDVAHIFDLASHLRLTRFRLLGISGGGPSSILYADTYPQMVEKLVLYGARARLDVEGLAVRQAVADFVRAQWGLGSETLANMLYAGASPEVHAELAQFQRTACTGEVAAGFLQDSGRDFSEPASRITAPTLVIHRRDDPAIPFRFGRDLASLIPDAQFIPIDGNEHYPWIRPERILQAIDGFLMTREEAVDRPAPRAPESGISPRELEVLRLLASGKSNPQIAEELVLSLNTVQRHVSNILAKTRTSNRTEAAVYARDHQLV